MYKKKNSGWLKHIDFMLIDVIMMQLGLLLACVIRLGFSNPYNLILYRRVALLLMLTSISVIFLGESHRGVLRRGYLQEFKNVFQTVTVIVGILMAMLYGMQYLESLSRLIFFTAWILDVIYVYVARCFRKRYLSRRRDYGQGQRAVLVVTGKAELENVLVTLQINNYEDLRVIGAVVVDSDLKGETFYGVPVVANQEDVLEYLRVNWVDEVFVKYPNEIPVPEPFIYNCVNMGITVHLNIIKMVPGLRNQMIESFAGYTVLSSSIGVATTRQLFCKRAMDICGALVGLFITGIAIIFVAPIIHKQSPGPIFFSQKRVGKNGKQFKLYKFRSMYMDAEERKKELMEQNTIKDGLMFKVDNDPRIFPFGHVIRKLSIDELPQFWNVLKGDMSLVGTRPPTLDEWVKYDINHRRRMATRPGITGMWQVSGRSNIKDFDEVVALDTQYITHWTLGLDLKILFKTVLVVLRREGSS